MGPIYVYKKTSQLLTTHQKPKKHTAKYMCKV